MTPFVGSCQVWPRPGMHCRNGSVHQWACCSVAFVKLISSLTNVETRRSAATSLVQWLLCMCCSLGKVSNFPEVNNMLSLCCLLNIRGLSHGLFRKQCCLHACSQLMQRTAHMLLLPSLWYILPPVSVATLQSPQGSHGCL